MGVELAILIAQGLASLGVGVGAAVTIGVAVVNALTYAAIGAALAFVGSQVFRPPEPKPEDIQSSIRQNTAPRVKHYGRVKASGPWTFGATKSGGFHKVIALGQGPIDAIEEYWVDDNLVTLDGSGFVTTSPYNSNCKIQARLGLDTETAYSDLVSAFTEYTTDFRGDNIASLYAFQSPLDQENVYGIFPNLKDTLYRVVLRGSKVKNLSTDVVEWSDNAADVIADFITSSDGMRLPSAKLETTEADAAWTAARATAEEAVSLKAGGTEKRWRIWGSYRLDERPGDVLNRMLKACDGRIYNTSDGGIALKIGDWAEPTVTLDQDDIVGFSNLSRGRNILSTANTITAAFLNPDDDYKTGDADPWVDATDVSERGEISFDTSYIMAPSHSQCRRLMKIESYRLNPSWVGTFQCKPSALAAMNERLIRITYPPFSINEVFEVQAYEVNFGEGGVVEGVTMTVQSMPEEAYNWNAATEEGTAPVNSDIEETSSIPLANLDVVLNASTQAILDWDDAASGLTPEAEYKLSSDSTWSPIGIATGESTATTGTLTSSVDYDFRVRFKSLTGSVGAWDTISNFITDTSDVDTGPVTGVSATGGVGEVTLDWTTPNAANYVATKIYRNTANDFGTADLIDQKYGQENVADSYTDEGLVADDYYYWLVARNAVDLNNATEVATGSVTVT